MLAGRLLHSERVKSTSYCRINGNRFSYPGSDGRTHTLKKAKYGVHLNLGRHRLKGWHQEDVLPGRLHYIERRRPKMTWWSEHIQEAATGNP